MRNDLGLEVLEPVRQDELGLERLKPSAKKPISISDKIYIKKVEGLSNEEKDSIDSAFKELWHLFGMLMGLIFIGIVFLWDTTIDLVSWDKKKDKEVKD